MTMSHDPESHVLHNRFAAVRRRLRFVATFRGLGWLLSILLVPLLLGGLLDWRVHLPSVVRALFLVTALGGGLAVAYRYLLRPLAAKTDDLTLALRVEAAFPGLNDSLASTVQFLESGPEEAPGSPALRQEAVRRALAHSRQYNFGRIVDARGFRSAGLSMIAVSALAVLVLVMYPTLARTAFLRLAQPFGSLQWPNKTQIELRKFRDRIGRNEAFEVRGTLRGVIPEKATVAYRLKGIALLEHSCDPAASDNGQTAEFATVLEPGRVQYDFEFQVRANDAATEWFKVAVLPPPVLVPLDGRASPQVRLEFPHYTELRAVELPDGAGNIEAVAGTVATLRAAADRPLARAWIEFEPENRSVSFAALFSPLGATHAASSLALSMAGGSICDRVPAMLAGDRRAFMVRFLPVVSGMYVLHFEDESGLHNSRLFELRVVPDPAPVVNLLRPSSKHDSLDVLPGADLTLHVQAEDMQYAVRSVFLEYRVRRANDSPETSREARRHLPLYDQPAAALAARGFAAMTPFLGRWPKTAQARLQQIDIERIISLSRLQPWLKEGDVIVLQACADDFDDVSGDKEPGRSNEIEIRIISKNALDLILNQEQGKIQQEIVRLREQQREAIKKVTEVEKSQNRQQQLRPDDLGQLLQAEQLQQQIRERVGTPQEGLRAETRRILETLKNNHLERSATQERMEMVGRELDRLAREELEQIEPRLGNARKKAESQAEQPKSTPEARDNQLTEARRHQEEVEKTLNDLLSRLEPWTSTREIKGEAKSILEDQRKLNDETQQLEKKDLLGKNPDELKPDQRAELNKAGEAQHKLEERVNQLLDKMDRVSQERAAKDPETSKELQKAQKVGKDANIAGQMKEAANQISQNKLSDAGKAQQASARGLEKLVQELEDKREAELDRLAKKLREQERRLDDLTQQQEELQKKIKEAGRIADPMKRQEELKRLAREQQRLQEQAQEMVKQLSRLRAERASQALSQAAGQMEQATRQMQQGQTPDDAQDEALDRLDDAQRELERAREQAEEELAREQMSKMADALKPLRERQERLLAETERIGREAQQNRQWTRGLLYSLKGLAESQQGLAQETKSLAEEKLAAAKVFARALGKSAAAMQKAGDQLAERRLQASADPGNNDLGESAAQAQRDALHRLDQLLDALKQDGSVGSRRPAGGGGGGGGGSGGGGGGGGDGGIPEVAQLKLLRAMQAEINQKTQDFMKQHPDSKRLADQDKKELSELRREQQEVSELLNGLMERGENP